jgi:MSHA biogenesis protein MshM
MYLAHFGLREYPFGLTPDTGYFYPGAGSQAALNTLLVALDSGEGLVKIVGEVGSGKTLLCRHLLNRLEGEGWATAFIPNPNQDPDTLVRSLARELGAIRSRSGSFSQALERRLLSLAGQGRRAVALVDEAQAMPLESLEALRLITNLETEKRKLLQIVLFGQPELDQRLAEPSVRQIRSRIAFHDRLAPLGAIETPRYLAHRLAQAGAAASPFTPATAAKLHGLSRGTPRLLNILAHKALLLAYGEASPAVLPRHARLAGLDTPGARLSLVDRIWRGHIH